MNFVFDVDGTLSFDGRSIGPEIRAAIQALERQDHRVIFASARPIRDLLPIVSEFKNATLIGGNGSIVSVAHERRVIAPIEMTDFLQIKTLIDRFNLDYVVDDEWNYSAKQPPRAPILRQLDPASLAKNVSLSQIKNPIKTILVNLSTTRQAELSQYLRVETSLEIVEHANEGNLDLTARKINKLTTLRQLGINQFIGFGNDQNDLQMLQLATHSVWVDSKPLQQLGIQFDECCAANDQAVSQKIQQFLN